MKVVFCCPTMTKPYPQFLEAMEASLPALEEAGIEHQMVFEVGCPYISAARATMLRKALDAKAEVVVFLDHDLSWRPEDLVRLIQTDGDVVAGLYRFKTSDEVKYMGVLVTDAAGYAMPRESDGAFPAERVPAGFLKVTADAVRKFMRAYPHLVFGDPINPSVDLFNHGAHEGVWWGEDYAFSRNWKAIGGEIWVVPDLSLDHHTAEESFPGNYHRFLLKPEAEQEAA